jgi:hypothetical protein
MKFYETDRFIKGCVIFWAVMILCTMIAIGVNDYAMKFWGAAQGTPLGFLYERIALGFAFISVAIFLAYGVVLAITSLRDDDIVDRIRVMDGPGAERYRLQYGDYASLLAVMSKGLEADGFEPLETVPQDPNMAWYSRKRGADIENIQIIRMSELSQSAHATNNEQFEAAFFARYPQINANRVFLVTCYCVDRVTDDFRKVVGMGDMWDMWAYELPVGVSFGSRTGYIAKRRKLATDEYVERYRQMLLRYWGVIREVSVPGDGMYELEVWWAYSREKKAFGHEIKIYSMQRGNRRLIHEETMDEVTPIVWETNDSVRVGQKQIALSHGKRVVVQDAGLPDEAE